MYNQLLKSGFAKRTTLIVCLISVIFLSLQGWASGGVLRRDTLAPKAAKERQITATYPSLSQLVKDIENKPAQDLAMAINQARNKKTIIHQLKKIVLTSESFAWWFPPVKSLVVNWDTIHSTDITNWQDVRKRAFVILADLEWDGFEDFLFQVIEACEDEEESDTVLAAGLEIFSSADYYPSPYPFTAISPLARCLIHPYNEVRAHAILALGRHCHDNPALSAVIRYYVDDFPELFFESLFRTVDNAYQDDDAELIRVITDLIWPAIKMHQSDDLWRRAMKVFEVDDYSRLTRELMARLIYIQRNLIRLASAGDMPTKELENARNYFTRTVSDEGVASLIDFCRNADNERAEIEAMDALLYVRQSSRLSASYEKQIDQFFVEVAMPDYLIQQVNITLAGAVDESKKVNLVKVIAFGKEKDRQDSLRAFREEFSYQAAGEFLEETILNNPNWELKKAALTVLINYHDPRMVPILINVVSSRNPAMEFKVVAMAAEALGILGIYAETKNYQAYSALADTLVKHYHSEVRYQCIRALENIADPHSQQVAVALVGALRDGDERISRKAFNAINNLGIDIEWALKQYSLSAAVESKYAAQAAAYIWAGYAAEPGRNRDLASGALAVRAAREVLGWERKLANTETLGQVRVIFSDGDGVLIDNQESVHIQPELTAAINNTHQVGIEFALVTGETLGRVRDKYDLIPGQYIIVDNGAACFQVEVDDGFTEIWLKTIDPDAREAIMQAAETACKELDITISAAEELDVPPQDKLHVVRSDSKITLATLHNPNNSVEFAEKRFLLARRIIELLPDNFLEENGIRCAISAVGIDFCIANKGEAIDQFLALPEIQATGITIEDALFMFDSVGTPEAPGNDRAMAEKARESRAGGFYFGNEEGVVLLANTTRPPQSLAGPTGAAGLLNAVVSIDTIPALVRTLADGRDIMTRISVIPRLANCPDWKIEETIRLLGPLAYYGDGFARIRARYILEAVAGRVSNQFILNFLPEARTFNIIPFPEGSGLQAVARLAFFEAAETKPEEADDLIDIREKLLTIRDHLNNANPAEAEILTVNIAFSDQASMIEFFLDDSDPHIRHAAFKVIARLPDHDQALPLLVRAMEDAEFFIIHEAAQILSHRGHNFSSIPANLGFAIKETSFPVLGFLSPNEQMLIVDTMAYLMTDDLKCQQVIINIYHQIMKNNTNEDVCRLAADFCGSREEVPETGYILQSPSISFPSIEVMREHMLTDSSLTVRYITLAQTSSMSHLVASLYDHSSIIRHQAASLLREYGYAEASEHLLQVTLSDHSQHVRITAAQTLGRVNPSQATEKLEAAVKDQARPGETRNNAWLALGDLGLVDGYRKIKFITDEVEQVSDAAYFAYGRAITWGIPDFEREHLLETLLQIGNVGLSEVASEKETKLALAGRSAFIVRPETTLGKLKEFYDNLGQLTSEGKEMYLRAINIAVIDILSNFTASPEKFYILGKILEHGYMPNRCLVAHTLLPESQRFMVDASYEIDVDNAAHAVMAYQLLRPYADGIIDYDIHQRDLAAGERPIVAWQIVNLYELRERVPDLMKVVRGLAINQGNRIFVDNFQVLKNALYVAIWLDNDEVRRQVNEVKADLEQAEFGEILEELVEKCWVNEDTGRRQGLLYWNAVVTVEVYLSDDETIRQAALEYFVETGGYDRYVRTLQDILSNPHMHTPEMRQAACKLITDLPDERFRGNLAVMLNQLELKQAAWQALQELDRHSAEPRPGPNTDALAPRAAREVLEPPEYDPNSVESMIKILAYPHYDAAHRVKVIPRLLELCTSEEENYRENTVEAVDQLAKLMVDGDAFSRIRVRYLLERLMDEIFVEDLGALAEVSHKMVPESYAETDRRALLRFSRSQYVFWEIIKYRRDSLRLEVIRTGFLLPAAILRHPKYKGVLPDFVVDFMTKSSIRFQVGKPDQLIQQLSREMTVKDMMFFLENDPDPLVRAEAVRVLEKLRIPIKDKINVLAKAADDANYGVASLARNTGYRRFEHVRFIAVSEEKPFDDLTEAAKYVDHPSPRVRYKAIKTIRASGDVGAAGHLMAAIFDYHPDVRQEAINALAEMNVQVSRPLLACVGDSRANSALAKLKRNEIAARIDRGGEPTIKLALLVTELSEIAVPAGEKQAIRDVLTSPGYVEQTVAVILDRDFLNSRDANLKTAAGWILNSLPAYDILVAEFIQAVQAPEENLDKLRTIVEILFAREIHYIALPDDFPDDKFEYYAVQSVFLYHALSKAGDEVIENLTNLAFFVSQDIGEHMIEMLSLIDNFTTERAILKIPIDNISLKAAAWRLQTKAETTKERQARLSAKKDIRASLIWPVHFSVIAYDVSNSLHPDQAALKEKLRTAARDLFEQKGGVDKQQASLDNLFDDENYPYPDNLTCAACELLGDVPGYQAKAYLLQKGINHQISVVRLSAFLALDRHSYGQDEAGEASLVVCSILDEMAAMEDPSGAKQGLKKRYWPRLMVIIHQRMRQFHDVLEIIRKRATAGNRIAQWIYQQFPEPVPSAASVQSGA